MGKLLTVWISIDITVSLKEFAKFDEISKSFWEWEQLGVLFDFFRLQAFIWCLCNIYLTFCLNNDNSNSKSCVQFKVISRKWRSSNSSRDESNEKSGIIIFSPRLRQLKGKSIFFFYKICRFVVILQFFLTNHENITTLSFISLHFEILCTVSGIFDV